MRKSLQYNLFRGVRQLVHIWIAFLRDIVDGQVLLIRRAKPPSLGCWSFPGGGLELAENIVDCAVREVAEETGVEIANAGSSPDGAASPWAIARDGSK